ncbi:MAG: hypothetical protein HQL37_12050 [Alphaproteobacteria bacterium]|nr:hypothetical protein [Alphaproteobacteria bacterium]
MRDAHVGHQSRGQRRFSPVLTDGVEPRDNATRSIDNFRNGGIVSLDGVPPPGLGRNGTQKDLSVAKYRSIAIVVLIGVFAFVVFSSNLRAIAAVDTFSTRYLPNLATVLVRADTGGEARLPGGRSFTQPADSPATPRERLLADAAGLAVRRLAEH